ncbi:MAG: UvrD-helicase domain-containing protein, partial [Oscillospiraceae bacterium]
LKTIANIYTLYQRKLKSANAVDFDDIIVLTVQLFLENGDVLEHYQNLYKYILVDEYQDTNHTQYQLVSLLARKNENLCVVGD